MSHNIVEFPKTDNKQLTFIYLITCLYNLEPLSPIYITLKLLRIYKLINLSIAKHRSKEILLFNDVDQNFPWQ